MATTEIFIYGPIGKGFDPWTGEAANSVSALVDALPKTGPVDLRVNSDGGDVFEARAMVEALARHNGQVTGYVDAIAASAASFVLAGCDLVKMAPGSMLMVHNPWSVAIGDAQEMRSTAELLDKVREDVVIPAYVEMGFTDSIEELRSLLDAETWLSAQEAIDLGLADEMARDTGEEVVALVRPGLWDSLPPELGVKPTTAPQAVKARLRNKARDMVRGYDKIAMARIRARMELGRARRQAELLRGRIHDR